MKRLSSSLGQERLTSRRRRSLRGVVIAALSALLVLAVPATAQANIPVPGAPNPVNILPSIVRGSLPVVGGTAAQNYLAVLLYKYGRNAQFWQAVSAQTAGTATAGQISLVQSTNGTWQMPATKLNTLTKVVGGVGTVIGGYTAGITIGAGTLDVLRDIGVLGFDPDGAVCGAVGTTFAPLLGADCTAFEQIPEGFEINTDASAGTFGLLCNTASTYCMQMTSPVAYTWKPSSTWHSGLRLCFDRTVGSGVPLSPNRLFVQSTGTGGSPVGISGIAATVGWVEMNVVAYTGPMGTGSQYNPDPLVCPAGSDVVGTFNWTGSPSSGVTWGIPAVPTAIKFGTSGTPIQQMSGDPLRQLQCIIVASGSTFSALSETFRESDGVLPTPVCPQVAGGLTLESTEIRELNLDDGTWLTLWSESTTPEFQAAGTLAPECANGTCMLDLLKNGVSCFQAPTACLDWFTDPNKASTYSCKYGTHVVDLSECTIYAPAFQPGSTTTGDTYGDPTTGQPVTNPNPTAGTDPDGSGQACYPSGWAVFNPLEWVYRPITCAAEWAFVPEQTVVDAEFARVETALAGTAPAQMALVVGSWDIQPVVTGCKIEYQHWDTGQTLPLVDACVEPMAGLATLSRLVSFIGVSVLVANVVRRQIAGMVDYQGH
jgi:hypothetical protein